MPAIDPTRLHRELEALKSGVNDPQRIARETRDLIEAYSEQSRSPALAVPAPVIRSLRVILRGLGNPESLSEALWMTGIPDSQLLAAGLLESIEGPDVATIAERWAAQSVPIEIVRELAERGLSGWRRVDPSGFIDQITIWLDDRKRRSRVLAAYAVRGRMLDSNFEDLPSVLELLEGRLAGVHGELREALVTLITSLAEVAPNETESFLDDEESSPLVRALKARINTSKVRVV